MNTRRWMVAHVVGTVIGVAMGMFIMNVVFAYLDHSLGLHYQSGFPADERLFPIQIATACLSGLIGGIFGDIAFQCIAGEPLDLAQVLFFGLFGIVGWTLVVPLALLGYIVVSLVTGPIAKDLIDAHSVMNIYFAVTDFVGSVFIPGLVFGAALAWIRLRLGHRKMLPEPGSSR